jgi:hypothetical protein
MLTNTPFAAARIAGKMPKRRCVSGAEAAVGKSAGFPYGSGAFRKLWFCLRIIVS